MSRTKKAGIFFAVMAILMIVLGVNDRDAEFLTTGIGICVVIGLIAYYLQGRKKRCPFRSVFPDNMCGWNYSICRIYNSNER